MKITHITIEQAKAIYPMDLPGGCEEWRALINGRIDRCNEAEAEQSEYITAAAPAPAPEQSPNPLQGNATELYKQGKLEPAYGYFDDLHQCQAAEIEKLKDDLQFVERWAVHHGTKSHVTPENVLSVIQHYPAITTITESYTDGKVPDTFNPYAEIAELKAQLAEALSALQTVIKQDKSRAVQRYIVRLENDMYGIWDSELRQLCSLWSLESDAEKAAGVLNSGGSLLARCD